MQSVLRASKLRTLAAPKLLSPQVQPPPKRCRWSSHYRRASAGQAPLSRLPRPTTTTTAAPESSSTIITPPPGTRTPPHQSSPQPSGHFSWSVLPAPSFSSVPASASSFSSSSSSSFTSSLWRTNSLPKISSLRAAQIARHLSSDNSTKMSAYTTRKVAAPYTLEHRVYIEKDGVPVSAFHDIPLYANAEQTILNMVVEIPRWTNAKLEVSF